MTTIRKIRTATTAGAAILLTALSVPAFAAESQASNTTNATVAVARQSTENAENRRICVREQLTGSRLNRTICRTRAEWERAGGLPTDR